MGQGALHFSSLVLLGLVLFEERFERSAAYCRYFLLYHHLLKEGIPSVVDANTNLLALLFVIFFVHER